MKLERCAVPVESELAIRIPERGLHGYLSSMHMHHRHWSRVEHETADGGDPTRHELAAALHRELFQSTALFTIEAQHPRLLLREHRERDRRRALGTMAISALIIGSLEDDVTLVDAGQAGMATDLVDMMVGPDGMPLEPRLHVMTAVAADMTGEEVHDGWYRAGQLYVHGVHPAQISEPMSQLVAAQGVTVDPADLVTLYPYMAAAA